MTPLTRPVCPGALPENGESALTMEQVIVQLAAAVNMRTLYPANHPRVIQTIEQVVDGVARVAAERHSDSITFLIVGDDLVVEQDVVRSTTLSQQQFVEIL